MPSVQKTLKPGLTDEDLRRMKSDAKLEETKDTRSSMVRPTTPINIMDKLKFALESSPNSLQTAADKAAHRRSTITGKLRFLSDHR